ncbi:hypothetical protein HFP15_24565 [Amycolatopsis sp. K13G38]|uniref:DNA ligase (ATP) n=1 Tax=Amycolatopsis acididurans TaxID=2724524 RepID=A0ABX1J8C7_9PSEU|nr:hypothetical protein [Amycolatopsis acididurans]NKQ56058.1 hypothetical protein [Amycolatopsis acididurans]
MRAVPGRLPINQRGWAWELKQHGVRALAVLDAGGLALLAADGAPLPRDYPGLTRLADDLGGRRMVLDGVISGGSRRSRYHAFDVLSVDGQKLVDEPYVVRRKLLTSLALTRSPVIDVAASHRNLAPAQLAQLARVHKATGIIGKRLAAPYRPGHDSPDWVELDLLRGCEAVIGGWLPAEDDADDGVRSLLLGVYDAVGRLVYIGRVATGFTNASRRALGSILGELVTERCPFGDRPPASGRERPRWVRPTLVADVDYRAIGHDGLIRQPSWRGLRTDVDPRDPAWSGSLRLQLSPHA